MGHQFLDHEEFGVCPHFYFCLPDRGIHTLNLDSIQRKYSVLLHIYLSDRIQHPGAGSFPLAIVFLLVPDICALADMEGMDPVMPALIAAAVVDATSCDDGYVRASIDVKIIIDFILHARGIYHYRNVHLLPSGIPINVNIDSRLIFLLFDLNMLAVPMTQGNTVVAQVVCAFLLES